MKQSLNCCFYYYIIRIVMQIMRWHILSKFDSWKNVYYFNIPIWHICLIFNQNQIERERERERYITDRCFLKQKFSSRITKITKVNFTKVQFVVGFTYDSSNHDLIVIKWKRNLFWHLVIYLHQVKLCTTVTDHLELFLGNIILYLN